MRHRSPGTCNIWGNINNKKIKPSGPRQTKQSYIDQRPRELARFRARLVARAARATINRPVATSGVDGVLGPRTDVSAITAFLTSPRASLAPFHHVNAPSTTA